MLGNFFCDLSVLFVHLFICQTKLLEQYRWRLPILFFNQYLIVRNLKTQIPEFKKYVFIDFYTYIMNVGAIFTSPNRQKCEYIQFYSHFG